MKNQEPNAILHATKDELMGAPFKTVFKATTGFYLAQFVFSTMFFGGIALAIFLFAYFY